MFKFFISNLFVIALCCFSCTNSSPSKTTENKPNSKKVESNQADLSTNLTAEDAIKLAKKVGDKAPNFALKNALGEAIQLADVLKKGPVVLTWYRGGWCPYCNKSLDELQQVLPQIQATGANLIAISPEIPDKSLSTKEKNKLKFEVLSDVGHKVSREYGLVFNLAPAVATRYQNKFDLHGYNGDTSDELPVPATYIIDQNGVIQYAFLEADYRQRVKSSDLLVALKKLAKK